MWPYCGENLNIWKCPADQSFVVVNGSPKPRVRSMSMNFYLGGFGGWDGSQFLDTGGYKLYFKQTELADPGPPRSSSSWTCGPTVLTSATLRRA